MLKVFFDLETNGLDRTCCDILQAAYAIFDGRKCIKSEILYFYYDDMMETPIEAYNVNHIAKSDLVKYKDDFRTNLHKLFVALCGSNVVGFNNDNFDNNFAKVYLQRFRSPEVWFGNSYDVMKIAMPLNGGRRISLVNLCKKFNFTEDMINAKAQEYFGQTAGAHNAFYDVAATIMCYFEEADRGMILDEPSIREPEISTSISAGDTLDMMDELTMYMYGNDTPPSETPIQPVTTNMPYESGCILCHTEDGYIPTCSDKTRFNSTVLEQPIDGLTVLDTPFIEDPFNRGTYMSIDFTQKLITTATSNTLVLVRKE